MGEIHILSNDWLPANVRKAHNQYVSELDAAIKRAKEAGVPQALIVAGLENIKFLVQYGALTDHTRES